MASLWEKSSGGSLPLSLCGCAHRETPPTRAGKRLQRLDEPGAISDRRADGLIAACFGDAGEVDQLAAEGWPPTDSCAPLLSTTCKKFGAETLLGHGHRAQVHDGRGIPVQADHLALRPRQRDAERHRRGVAHGADVEEVVLAAPRRAACAKRRARGWPLPVVAE